jgi:bis(5'-nucleosidyl)-tetraphosphatase
VVRKTAAGCRYLLLRCYNYWDFPKGLLEEHEAAIDAARREVAEETGITELAFRWGYDYAETEPYGSGKVSRYYVACTSQEKVELCISPELGRPEHDEYRWVSYREGQALVVDRLRPVLDWAHRVSSCA